jgi:hypothetical protein
LTKFAGREHNPGAPVGATLSHRLTHVDPNESLFYLVKV